MYTFCVLCFWKTARVKNTGNRTNELRHFSTVYYNRTCSVRLLVITLFDQLDIKIGTQDEIKRIYFVAILLMHEVVWFEWCVLEHVNKDTVLSFNGFCAWLTGSIGKPTDLPCPLIKPLKLVESSSCDILGCIHHSQFTP